MTSHEAPQQRIAQSQLSNRQQKTRRAFLSAFVELVAQHGFDRVTVTDIAEAANYGRWTFYQYFESKEAIAWAVFEHWIVQLDHDLVDAVRHLVSPQREYESWRMIFHAVLQQAQFFTRLDSALQSAWRTRAKELLIQQFLRRLNEGHFTLMAGVRPEIAARLYVASLLELLEYWGRHPELGGLEAILDEFYSFIFNQPPPK